MDENAYSGRWVARLRGRIIAQGGTPEQARLAALSRFKERPEIIFMPSSDPLSFPPLLQKILSVLPSDQVVYLVGGAVRDLLLGRPIHDFDFAVPTAGIPTARKVANALGANFYPLDQERDAGRVLISDPDQGRVVADFTSFRGSDLDADLLGRDFTMNAIAIDPRTRQVFDPLGGAGDLRAKCLKSCSPSSLTDDPLRILRGIRLAANYGFHILPETRREMKVAVPGLASVSPERVRDELFRILEGSSPASCLRALEMLGVLPVILQEVIALKGLGQPEPHVHDGWEHTLATLSHLEKILSALALDYDPEKASDLHNGLMVLRIGRYREQITSHLSTYQTTNRTLRSVLFFAALYHDVAKPLTRKEDETGQLRFWEHDQQGAMLVEERARQLTLSNEEILRARIIVSSHMRILFHANRFLREGKSPSRRAIYRFFRDTGSAGVELCLLALADTRATYENHLSQETWVAMLDVVRLFLENWFERPLESIAPLPLLNGNELMAELGLQPGPKVGELLEAIREAQAIGEVNTRDQAFAFARSKMDV